MKIARGEYGPQVKRFYHRGLKQLPRETFIVERKGGIRKRHPDAKAGMRAWRDGLTLYPSARVFTSEFIASMKTARAQRSAHSLLTGPAPKARVSGSSMTGYRRVGASVPGEIGGVRIPSNITRADAPTAAHRKDTPDLSQGGRDASSRQKGSEFAAEWLQRMLAKARKEGPPEPR